MALTVEDGTGLAGAESYVSVAEADTYHTDRGNSAWTDIAATATKEAYLRDAVAFLDGVYESRFRGRRKERLQALAWPRVGFIDSDGFRWDSDEVPVPIKRAQMELALRRIDGELGKDESRGESRFRDIKAGPVTIRYREHASSPSSRYPEVEVKLARLFRPYRKVVRA